ncbi:hypothetical protein AVEN_198513-1 [Araneus ventricosus]|uniref:Uncharacterized protein n=1 Tax=Araneus ventricosus TaxID=182803 RepID=A0A4Y2J9X4_ARAVE|nr:hypothetical protein AVEN_198513-1 [Araneus ventricosus]
MTRTTPELAPLLQTSASHQREDVSSTKSDLACTRPIYTADLQWNQVSNLEVCGPILQPGYFVSTQCWRINGYYERFSMLSQSKRFQRVKEYPHRSSQ